MIVTGKCPFMEELVKDSSRLSREDYRLMDWIDRAFYAKKAEILEKMLYRTLSSALKIRAVCVLCEIGTANSVYILSRVLLEDKDPLVRHEAAFALGQMGYRNAVPSLIKAMLTDSNILVRHEAAGALGSIGDISAMNALLKAEMDGSPEVRESASLAIMNLEYLGRKNFFQQRTLIEE